MNKIRIQQIDTGSLTVESASYALSSSHATTASYAENAASTFNGTDNFIPMFTESGTNITDSIVSQSGGSLYINGNVTIGDGTATNRYIEFSAATSSAKLIWNESSSILQLNVTGSPTYPSLIIGDDNSLSLSNPQKGSLIIGKNQDVDGDYCFSIGENVDIDNACDYNLTIGYYGDYINSDYIFAVANSGTATKSKYVWLMGNGADSYGDNLTNHYGLLNGYYPYAYDAKYFFVWGDNAGVYHTTSSCDYVFVWGKNAYIENCDYGFTWGEDATINGASNVWLISLDNTQNYTATQGNTMAIMGGSFGVGTLSPSTKLEVVGNATISGSLYVSESTYMNGDLWVETSISSSVIYATTKYFNIPHPIKENKRLIHAATETNKHDVYYRGILSFNRYEQEKEIELPEYFWELIFVDSVTVQLSPIKQFNNYLYNIDNKRILVNREFSTNTSEVSWLVFGERKDVGHLVEEI